MQPLKTFIKNSKGSAQLVAVIAAAAISSVIMLSNAQMVTTFNKQNKNVLTANVNLDLRKQIAAFLTNPDNCKESFRNKHIKTHPAHSASPHSLTSLNTNMTIQNHPTQDAFKDSGGTRYFQPGTKYDNNLVTYLGWSLNDTTTLIQPANPPTGARMIVDLNLFMRDTENKTVIRTIKLEVTKTGGPNSLIDTCFTASVANAEKWTRFPGGVDIYNSDLKNVGMFLGPSLDPIDRVHIAGSAKFTEILRQGSVINDGPTTVDSNLLVAGTTTHIGGLWGANRLNVTGNAAISGNLPTSGNIVAQNLSSVTTTETDGNLTVQQLATFGPVGGTGTRLQQNGPVYFNADNTDPEVTPDHYVHGSARFNSAVRTTSSVSVGGPPLLNDDFRVYGNSSIVTRPGDPAAVLSTGGDYLGISSLCINGNCRTTFAEQTCSAGMWRLNVDGTVACANMNCPSGSLFKGLDASGNAQCEPLPNTFCPPGEYLQSINPGTGARTCRALDPQVDVLSCGAPNGNGGVSSVLTGISNGNPICTPATITPDGLNCPVGTVAGGFNADGTVSSSCVPPARGNPLNCGGGLVAIGMHADGRPICGQAYDPLPCPSQYVARGIASNGQLICQPVSHLLGGTCGGTAVAVGILGNGAPECGCKAEALTWVENGNVCDATVPASAPGNVVATDSDGVSTGSATFTCTTTGWITTASSPDCNVPPPPAPPTWTTTNATSCNVAIAVGDPCSPAGSWLYPTPPSLYDYCACSNQRPGGSSAPSGQVSLHGWYCGSDGKVMISDTTAMGPCL